MIPMTFIAVNLSQLLFASEIQIGKAGAGQYAG
jgi:hypothetical protein